MGASTSTPVEPSIVHGTTILTVLEKVPQLLMTIAASELTLEGSQQDHASFSICKELNMLRLVSKRVRETVMQASHCCHLRLTDRRLQPEPSLHTAMLRISTSLIESQLTHLHVSLVHTHGFSGKAARGTPVIEHQLRDCLLILRPVLISVTHLKLTCWIDKRVLLNVVTTASLLAILLKQLIFSGQQTVSEALDMLCPPSITPATLLAEACPNLTHLTVNAGTRKDSLELLGKRCTKINSLHFLDNDNGAEYLMQSLPHLPHITHITMLFWRLRAQRVSDLLALSASPNLTHLTLGAGSMVSMSEWAALPEGLRELRIGGANQVKRLKWSWWFDLVKEPLLFDKEVELMLGLQVGQLDRYSRSSVILVCTRVSSSHTWVCVSKVEEDA